MVILIPSRQMSGICNVIIGMEKDSQEGTKHLSSIQRGINATGSLCSQVKGQGASASSSSLANSQLPKVSSGVKCMSHIASRRSSHEMFLDNFLLSYLSFLCLQAMLFLVAVHACHPWKKKKNMSSSPGRNLTLPPDSRYISSWAAHSLVPRSANHCSTISGT